MPRKMMVLTKPTMIRKTRMDFKVVPPRPGGKGPKSRGELLRLRPGRKLAI